MNSPDEIKQRRQPPDGKYSSNTVGDGKLALIIVGGAFVAVLSLLFGIQIGRNLGVDEALKLTQVEPLPEADPAELEEIFSEKEESPEITFYTELKQITPEIATDPEPCEDATESAPPAVSRNASEDKKLQKTSEDENSTNTPRVVASPPPVHEDASVHENEKNKTYYTIQIGSFKKRTAAEALAEDVRAKGQKAEVVEAQLAQGVWYRVRVGDFNSREEAAAHFQKKLKPLEIEGFVTRR